MSRSQLKAMTWAALLCLFCAVHCPYDSTGTRQLGRRPNRFIYQQE
jgi:hypothetical protein